MRRRWFLIAGLLILLCAWPVYAWEQGPAVLVLVPYRSVAEQVRAQALPLSPLALVPVDGELWVLARAAPLELQALSLTGAYEVLAEPDPAAGRLWLVDFTAQAAVGEPVPDLEAAGRVLWRHTPHALLQATETEAAQLNQEGLALISLDASIALAPRAALLPPAPTLADPTIAARIAQLDPVEVEGWDRRLSGEEAVLVGGASYFLRSRYSASTSGRRSEQYVTERLQDMGYAPSYFSYATPYGGQHWRDIVLDIPGRLDPSRIVILAAHLDSISFDGSQAATLAPGADDNGTGAATLLAIAGLMRGQATAYTLRLVWFTGEEFGYWGSKPYTQYLANRGEDVMAAIDIDMFGYDGDGDRVVEVHTGTLDKDKLLGDYLAAANDLYGLNLTLERKTTTAAFFSDHRSFWNQGYTSLMVIENFFDDTGEFGRAPDRNPNYHKTTDRLRSVSIDYTTAIGRMALAAALHLAQPFPVEATPSPTATATPPTGGCTDRVVNGGFEVDAGWRFGVTAATAGYSSAAAHSGSRGLRTGITSQASNARAFSSGYQALALPGASSVTLTLWLRGPGTDAADYGEILLLNSGYGVLARLWRGRPSGSGWTQLSFDLTPYRGRDLVLYFNTYNDGAGSATWTYFDDVSILACTPASPTPSETPAATTTPTPSPTATPTATPPAPTMTPTPTSTWTPAATWTPTPESTTTPTPTAVVCSEGVTNGGFETDEGWLLPATASRAAYTSASAHTGARSLRLGLLPASRLAPDSSPGAMTGEESNLLGEHAPAGATYSTAHQTVILPAGAASLTLTLWRQPGTTAAAGDWQRLLLLKPNTYAVLATLWRGLQNDDAWQPAAFDLTPYRGQTVVLYFEVYNDSTGAAGRTWLFVDDISLTACGHPAPGAALESANALYLPSLRNSHR